MQLYQEKFFWTMILCCCYRCGCFLNLSIQQPMTPPVLAETKFSWFSSTCLVSEKQQTGFSITGSRFCAWANSCLQSQKICFVNSPRLLRGRITFCSAQCVSAKGGAGGVIDVNSHQRGVWCEHECKREMTHWGLVEFPAGKEQV